MWTPKTTKKNGPGRYYAESGLKLFIPNIMKQIKKIFLALTAIGFLCLTGVNAQGTYNSGQLAINAGISYGFDMEELGLRAGATYFLNDKMRVGGDLTYWLLESYAGFDQTALEINGNFNYIFYDNNDLMFYGIGTLGIHYVKVSFDMGEFGSGDTSDSELGFGLGIGGEYNLGAVALFAEQKFMLAGFDQPKFNLGVRIYL